MPRITMRPHGRLDTERDTEMDDRAVRVDVSDSKLTGLLQRVAQAEGREVDQAWLREKEAGYRETSQVLRELWLEKPQTFRPVLQEMDRETVPDAVADARRVPPPPRHRFPRNGSGRGEPAAGLDVRALFVALVPLELAPQAD